MAKEPNDKKGRPKYLRRVEGEPMVNYFKPRGIPLKDLETVELEVEELEAIKLVHHDRVDREDAAKKMGISRRTMERELRSGLWKITEALLYGKAIEIRGGCYFSSGEPVYKCLNDDHEWSESEAGREADKCPECGSGKIRVKDVREKK
ncbi:MAG: DUF134 domain-containing protein [Candidatus Altiarchaeota archaeon]|nr:DUF134 domain-containing protein [Candidatus Altiarchaeota archaeon]